MPEPSLDERGRRLPALGGCEATGQTVGPGSPSWGHSSAGGQGVEPRALVPVGTIRTAVAAPCPQACLSPEHQRTSCWGQGQSPGPHPRGTHSNACRGSRPPRKASARTGNSCSDPNAGPLLSVCINTLSAWRRGLALPANQSADTSAHGRHSMFPTGLRSACSSIL